ncbi:hypothetical protein [Neisseria dentiae]|uniref:hypothetical protein n=1 Tax=Neisseria dentiae TaxID=194197 RepID=UPI00211C4E99|nr:hypothetical protein [Neisseria dentiae]MCQ9326292.1 hypothetical protein [Neisseria dentiae]
MSHLEKKYILELDSALSDLDDSSTSFELLEIIISWLSNDFVINEFKKLGYDFSKYVHMEPEKYPIEKSILSKEEIVYFKNNIRRKKLNKKFKFQYFAQYIRDTLEHLFIEHIERACPNCEWGEMQKLEEKGTHKDVYLCTQCGNAFYADNSQIISNSSLVIPIKPS